MTILTSKSFKTLKSIKNKDTSNKVIYLNFSLFCLLDFETGSQVAQVGLELPM